MKKHNLATPKIYNGKNVMPKTRDTELSWYVTNNARKIVMTI